jgi:hypothetical protein
MLCPRCSIKMQNVVEYILQENEFKYIKNFYCTKCKSAVTEVFDDIGLASSEWIDFNV